MTKLPTYEEAEAAIDAGTETAIDWFIYDQEPVINDRVWRRLLVDVLNLAAGETRYEYD